MVQPGDIPIITFELTHTILSFSVKLLSFGQQYNKVLRGVGVLAILLDGLKQHEFLLGADQHNGNPDQLERKFSYSSFKKHSGSKDDIISSSKLIESLVKKRPTRTHDAAGTEQRQREGISQNLRRLLLLFKDADSVVLERLAQDERVFEEEYNQFDEEFPQDKNLASTDWEEIIKEVAERIEKDLILLAALLLKTNSEMGFLNALTSLHKLEGNYGSEIPGIKALEKARDKSVVKRQQRQRKSLIYALEEDIKDIGCASVIHRHSSPKTESTCYKIFLFPIEMWMLANQGIFKLKLMWKIRKKTTFTCPFGTYAYRRMPFGLCNAPTTFQRCMLSIFSDMVERIMEVFMDDITVYGGTFEECLINLQAVLHRCIEKDLVLNWEKCHFMVCQGIVLGHIISEKGIEVDKAKVELIVKLPSPTTVKGVRQFLGHAGFYRRFIKGFSSLSKPLCELLAKDAKFIWDERCQNSFDQLKKFLTTTPIVRAPNWQLPFELMCDASDFAIGAVLGQREDGKPYVIYYASKTLNEAQRNYTTTEKEFSCDQIIRKCVPEDEQQGILNHCHENACGGHFASQKTP
ncbi:Retrovirus-related Pol polyprotein from transposon 17.6 [Vitis vinifera]|uniref:Retrovirus-related Pol polyprotein from transposon 17.6 n=1 Tax=Vitis vinifera TaxID=29760 RepID=A0A438H2U4_VITVI|nr:Retrovirus-related Pol polyprotein from transposon 17.6 [Vitis vinifera]